MNRHDLNSSTLDSSVGAVLKIAENVWIFDDLPIEVAGLELPVRMTIVRLASGDLLLHSPTRHSSALQEKVERLGNIRYLVAPSVGHWMFITEWQRSVPGATTMAVAGLRERRQVRESGLRIDCELGDGSPEEWNDEIETILVASPLFAEIALFHKLSRTLVLTDLVQNIPPKTLPPATRFLARLLGITAPDGMAPLYLRLSLRFGGRAPKLAAARMIAMAPERVVFAHGDWFNDRATERLRMSLRWLLAEGPSRADVQHQHMKGLRVVITGASSGIGRAAALRFAQKGATVALAARRTSILQSLASECEALGGRALAITTDVTDPDAVERLAKQTEQAFGGIDIWINNAGTGVFGAYQDADISLHRRTVEVNLLGTMHGCYAVLPIFLRQQRGVLINNISLGGWAPTPFAAAYTASKFGLRGFTASLRQELAEHSGIHVCGVFPAMIDTPGFVHGANVSGRRLDPGPLLYQPEDVAETFIRLAADPQDEVAVGWPARAGQISYAVAPRPTEHVVGTAFRFLLSRARPDARTEGTMKTAAPAGNRISGSWLARKGIPPAGQITRLAAAAGVLALIMATGAMLRHSRGRRGGIRKTNSLASRHASPDRRGLPVRS